jgi:hypothetical protein
VRASLTRLLQDGDSDRFASPLLVQLRQSQSGRHPGRAAANDQRVNFEGLSVQTISPRLLISDALLLSQRRSLAKIRQEKGRTGENVVLVWAGAHLQ